ncbi:MAG: exodeoxyribonuclease VII large subunit [Alphaproteobacteria bacterium]|nr:exodeoxyribonuclease VII large subunit [Alphaproteobacteria bacterium]
MENNDQPILSVTEISLSLKGVVEQVFQSIRVRGEVSGIKTVASGHTYFSLKDKDSVLSAICWRGRSHETMAALQEGLEVICSGKLSTYPGRSNYQMIVESAEPAGVGALLKLLNERREKLAKEGLFDEAHKQKIPFLPENIGVITSPTGAVIRDIMHRLSDRFPRPVYLWPVAVQGEGATEQIVQAIHGFNAIPAEGLQTSSGIIPRPDVLIVARGGGSLEDLWCFNEESIVRAVFDSAIPVISAVGHETDTTLIDYVADLRAPTPTGAAEKAVPVRHDLLLQVQNQTVRLTESLYRYIENQKLRLDRLILPNLTDVVSTLVQTLDDRSERLENAKQGYFQTIKLKFESISKLLKSYSYQSILERGFALVSGASGKIIEQSQAAKREKRLHILFTDGSTEVIPVEQISNVRIKKQNTVQQQGDLFNDL